MKFENLFFAALLAMHASAIKVRCECHYVGGSENVIKRKGYLVDRKARGLIEGMNTWSSGQFDAMREGDSIVVSNTRIARDAEVARTMCASMISIIARYAADN